MKKLALTIVCGLAVSGVAFAQNNLVSFVPAHTLVTAQTNTAVSALFGGTGTGGTVGVTAQYVPGGLQYDYTLLYQTQSGYQVLATDKNVWDGTWTDTGLTATNASNFQGALNPVGVTATTVPWSNPTTNSIVLVVWSANLGSSWTVVSNILSALANHNTAPLFAADPSGANAFFGESAFGYIQPTVSPASGAGIFGSSASQNGLPIYSLNTQLYLLPVPEPATMALAGLGGLSMLLFRRQRK
jgi:hypothetical protein